MGVHGVDLYTIFREEEQPKQAVRIDLL